MTGDPTLDAAEDIIMRHWAQMQKMEAELSRMKVLDHAGLLAYVKPEHRTLMQMLDEDTCGYCGRTKKRGEWCDNSQCSSQERRRRNA